MGYKPLTILDIATKTKPAFERFNVQKAAVFGSGARGEMQHGSDVDILIDLGAFSSGLIFIDIQRSLEYALQRKVDLVSYKSLDYSDMKEEILAEAKVIYEKRS